MKKKALEIILIGILSFTLTGCGKNDYEKFKDYFDESDFDCKTGALESYICTKDGKNGVNENFELYERSKYVGTTYKYSKESDDSRYTIQVSFKGDKKFQIDAWFYDDPSSDVFTLCEYMPVTEGKDTIEWDNGIKTKDVDEHDASACDNKEYKKEINKVLERFEEYYEEAGVKLGK